jgi:hypothetical protein
MKGVKKINRIKVIYPVYSQNLIQIIYEQLLDLVFHRDHQLPFRLT